MRQIIETTRGFTIRYDYSAKITEAVRLIPGRAFNYQDKTWTAPLSSRRFIDDLVNKFHFSMSGVNSKPIMKPQDMRIPEMPVLLQDIPLKMQPYSYQRQGIAYGIEHKRFINGDAPGLGKTGQAIATAIAVGQFPVLIICPSSLKINWEREWEMWSSHKATILSDSIKNSWPNLYEMRFADVFIVNYESLKKYFVAEINQPINPETGKKAPLRLNHIKFKSSINRFKQIIIDEGHRCKDSKTMQSKLVKGICTGKEYVQILTGTPVVNKPDDLISQLGIIDRLQDFGGYREFEKLYCNNNDRHHELQYLLKKNCYFRREKKDVLKDLPDKIRQKVYCDITTRKEYNDALSDLEDYLKRYKYATDEQIQKSLKGEVMVRIGILKNISARGKIKDAVEYISDVIDSGEKLILFTHLRDVQQTLMKFFPAAATIFGDDDSQKRQHNIDRFQKDPNVQLIICSIKAAGVGITLTASSRVAFLELPWHPADCEQCEDRAHRIGQKDSVNCIYLIGKDTIDEHIYDIIENKRSLSSAITGARNDVEESIQHGIINLLSKKL